MTPPPRPPRIGLVISLVGVVFLAGFVAGFLLGRLG